MSDLITYSTTALAPQSTLNALLGVEAMLYLGEQVEPPVRHFFGTNTYAREMTIDPDVVVSGAMHKGSTITVILTGEAVVWTNHGNKEYYSAGDVIVTPELTKRMWYSAQGCTLLTIHGTTGINTNTPDKATLDELERQIIVPEADFEKEIRMKEYMAHGHTSPDNLKGTE